MYSLPKKEILTKHDVITNDFSPKNLEFNLKNKLASLKLTSTLIKTHVGSSTINFEIEPSPNIRYQKFKSISDDLAIALRVPHVTVTRTEFGTISIQIPKNQKETVHFVNCLDSLPDHELHIILGKTESGNTKSFNLTECPHLLIAGATGTGKSVFLNNIIMSLLFKNTVDDMQLILIDPKRIEFNLYQKLSHLVTNIVTEIHEATKVLEYAIAEMQSRYKILEQARVRNIKQFHSKGLKLPYLVIIIDEFAELTMMGPNNIEQSIVRLAQLSRAVGIHLIIATQRPSVDVITGLIKANFPTRIAFRVSSKIDSRTILDQNGAEYLTGKGDLLFSSPQEQGLIRASSPLVLEDDIEKVVNFVSNQNIQKNRLVLDYKPQIQLVSDCLSDTELFHKAISIGLGTGILSEQILQTTLQIDLGKARKIIKKLLAEGYAKKGDSWSPAKITIYTV